MSRTNRFLGGIGVGYLQQCLILMTGLWLTPFFLTRLGQYNYGVWLIITQVSVFLSLLDLGVVGLLPRETAFAVGRGGAQSSELPRLIGQTTRMVLFQWPVVAICASLVWLFGRVTWRSAEIPLVIILSVFVAMFPLRVFSAVLQGLQDLAFLGRIQILVWTTGTVTSVALVLAGYGILSLAVSWAVCQFLVGIFCWFRLKYRFPGVLPRQLSHFDRPAAVGYLKKSTWISASQVAQILTAGSDMLLVGKMLGPAATVPYSCTGKLAGVLANKPQMLMQAAFPGLSELRAAGSRSRIRRATSALSQAMLMLSGAVACVVLAVNRSFVSWWTGPSQYGGGLLTVLIIIAMLMRHWNTTFTYSLFCFGHERRLAIIGVLDGSVSIIVSAILLPVLGPVGAPIGMLAGICFVNMPANLIALGREMEVSGWSLISSSMNWALRFVVAAVIAATIGAVWKPQGFVPTAALGLVSGLVYLGLLMPILLREPLGSYIRPRLRFLPAPFHRLFPALAG